MRSLDKLRNSPALHRSRAALARHRHNLPLFIARQTLSAFQQHNDLGVSASLAFYAMFALIPLTLLMLFVMSQLITTSDRAIVQLAILTSNLLPRLSQTIMVEVYNFSAHRAAWGVLGLLALLWAITPLAAALRTSLQGICRVIETPSFLRRKLSDVLAVLGILLLLLAFTLSGMLLEKLLGFLRPEFVSVKLVNGASSLITIILVLTAFFRVFFPASVPLRQLLAGALLTALLWLLMRPAFELLLASNQSFGSIFGGMKNIFISIGWLYYSFAAFLLGAELIATLRRKHVLLLKGLFGSSHSTGYLDKLMRHFGAEFACGEHVFREGDSGRELYYIVSGSVEIRHRGHLWHTLEKGAYFGEMAILAGEVRSADAVVSSERAELLRISADTLETLLMEEPKVALNFLRDMALRLRQSLPARPGDAAHASHQAGPGGV